jgi:hypothetical protein
MFKDLPLVPTYLVKLRGEKPQAMTVDTTGELSASVPLFDGAAIDAYGRPLMDLAVLDLQYVPRVGRAPRED